MQQKKNRRRSKHGIKEKFFRNYDHYGDHFLPVSVREYCERQME